MTNWIFQTNPKRYIAFWDVYDTRDELDWEWDVMRYAGEIRHGDRAAIWVCGYRGDPDRRRRGLPNEAGVYAIGKVHGDIRRAPIESGWREEDIGRERLWVTLEDMRWLDRPILRTELKADPRFEDASILTVPRAGNPFPVTDQEWQAIASRTRQQPVPR